MHLTRWTDKELGRDTNSDLAVRANLANSVDADIFISVHCNSADNPAARGMEVYTLPGDGPADKLAEEIVRAWESAFPGMIIRKDLSDGDSDKEANFYVLRKTAMPAVLIELAFISNPEEERMLAGREFQEAAAAAIAGGVKKYFNLEGVAQVAEPWKEQIMEWGRDKDKLNLAADHNPDDPAPKWFIVAVAQRTVELAKKEMLAELIRRLNPA